jgi:putative ABC transport system permease protein
VKLWRFILKNILRNKRRTLLTVVSLAASIFIVITLISVLRGLDSQDMGDESHLRLVVRHKVSLTNPLPEAYWAKLKQVPHVDEVCPSSWYQGVYKDQSWENFFARFAVDPESYLALVKGERPMDEAQARAWLEDRRGAIAGKALFDQFGWKLGDIISVKGDIYPADIEVTLRGVYTSKVSRDEEKALFFHREYLEEMLGKPGQVGTYWLKVDAAENIPAVQKGVDAMFANSSAETRTETEKQFNLGFVSMMGNVKGLLSMLSLVVGAAILMVSANTMAMAVRERTTEVAVLKALGFTPARVLGTILAESILISLIAGAIACFGSLLIFNILGFKLPMIWWPMGLSAGTAVIALTIAGTIGFVSGAIPGFFAARLPVAVGLRKVA